MAYEGIAWPGLALSIKAVNSRRIVIARWIKSLDENPKAYKRPKQLRTKWCAMQADLDTGLRVLRGAVKERQPRLRPRRAIGGIGNIL